MRQKGRSARESLPFLERARALSSGISDRETYLISGMFHSVIGQLADAAAALEALLRLHPDDRQAIDILVEVYGRSGRSRRAADLAVVRAEKFPDDFYANVRAAQALAVGTGHTNRAGVFAERANRLASPEAVAERTRWNAWLQVLPVFQRWVAGDAKGALETLTLLDRSLAARLGRERDAFASAVGFAHLAFGRARQADDAFRYGSAPERQLNLAVLALVQGDEAGARRWLDQVKDHSARRPALFARVGFEREARRGLEDLPASDHAEGIAAVTEGLLALRHGQIERATRLLRSGLDLLRGSGEPAYFFATEALAAVANSRGDVDRSIRLLSDAAAERPHTYAVSQWTAAYWIRMNADLVRQCRRAGRHDEAERVSGGLRQILDPGTHAAAIGPSVSR
jgi:tetratricopeptide (TPR) repeat protein